MERAALSDELWFSKISGNGSKKDKPLFSLPPEELQTVTCSPKLYQS